MASSAGEHRELNLRGTLGGNEPMSGLNPNAMNEEKCGMASRGKKEGLLTIKPIFNYGKSSF